MIQALKKSVPKGDKKRKKEVAAEISSLEQQLEEIRGQKEISPTQTRNLHMKEEGVREDGGERVAVPEEKMESVSVSSSSELKQVPPKLSKARKKRVS